MRGTSPPTPTKGNPVVPYWGTKKNVAAPNEAEHASTIEEIMWSIAKAGITLNVPLENQKSSSGDWSSIKMMWV